MIDYRRQVCIIDGKIIKDAIGQDPDTLQVDFKGTYGNFSVPESRVRILTDEEFAELNLYGKINSDFKTDLLARKIDDYLAIRFMDWLNQSLITRLRLSEITRDIMKLVNEVEVKL